MKAASPLIFELAANFLAPYLVYEALHKHYGDTKALLASIVPPLLWSGYELIKTKKLDALSMVIIASILFTVIATAMGGSARLIQVRDALVTGAIGVMFLISLAFEKPLIFYLGRAISGRRTDDDAPDFDELWQLPTAPRAFKLITTVWGVGLVLQTALLCFLAYRWSISRYLLVSPFISYGMIGGLTAWSFWYGEKRHKAVQQGNI